MWHVALESWLHRPVEPDLSVAKTGSNGHFELIRLRLHRGQLAAQEWNPEVCPRHDEEFVARDAPATSADARLVAMDALGATRDARVAARDAPAGSADALSVGRGIGVG